MFNGSRIIPVITMSDKNKAVPLAKAIWDGGLPCIEITFRTPQAAACIAEIRKGLPLMHISAGTILTAAQADEGIQAGADCIVSPGFNPKVVGHCQKKMMPIVPGCCTPTEIEQALSFGIYTVKFFPAEASGGCGMIKALSAPYGNVCFVPTGGICLGNIHSYLAIKSVLACGGSWMAKDEWVNNNNFENVFNSVKESLALINQK
jgi:2-dehydro-3-deoxyphosphogluconate aldolase/(4S)-4-hydroxy-2-oxoglutarate aldolase